MSKSSNKSRDGQGNHTPAVSIQSSITNKYLICLECGNQIKSLPQHLRSHKMTFDEYLQKWALPDDYPKSAATALKRKEASKADQEIWEKAEHENTEHDVSVETSLAEGDAILYHAMKTAQDLSEATEAAMTSEEIEKGTYALIDAGHKLKIWGQQNPESFDGLMEEHNCTVRPDAGECVAPIKLILHVAKTNNLRSKTSKMASCVDFAMKQEIPIEPGHITKFLQGFGGWTSAYTQYCTEILNPEKKTKKRERELKNVNTLKHLTSTVEAFAPLPISDKSGWEPCVGYPGFGLIVFRWNPEGENGVLGLLKVEPEKATEIILKHGVALDEAEVERLISTVLDREGVESDA